MADELKKHGFNVERRVAGMPTTFVAVWGEAKPFIGIMDKYDALPRLSQKNVPWKEPLERGKPSHERRYNIHGTSGMAAAIALKKVMEKYGIEGTNATTHVYPSVEGVVCENPTALAVGVSRITSHCMAQRKRRRCGKVLNDLCKQHETMREPEVITKVLIELHYQGLAFKAI